MPTTGGVDSGRERPWAASGVKGDSRKKWLSGRELIG
jgi:hypothetical protein